MMKINLNDIISYVFIAAGLVSLVAGYMAKYDKKHAQFWTDLHNGADALVAQQDTVSASNPAKKATASAQLVEQMNALGHKHVDLPTAQGAIEQAVTKRKEAPVVDKPEPLLDDLKVGE